jgi:hypothetical protein
MSVVEESRILAMQRVQNPSSSFPYVKRGTLSVASGEQYKRPRTQTDFPDMKDFPDWVLNAEFSPKVKRIWNGKFNACYKCRDSP